MSSTEETIFQEVLAHIDRKENSRARDLLTRLIKLNPNKTQYWLWMSAVTETTRERFRLKEALRLDPNNEAAQRGLAMLGVIPVNPALVIPLQFQKRRWESLLEKAESQANNEITKRSWRQILPYGGAAILIAALALVTFWGIRSLLNGMPKTAQVYLGPTDTYAPTLTKVATKTQIPSAGQPTPLWMLLKETYTPTPLPFVPTPHSSEAFSIAMHALADGDFPKALSYITQAIILEPGSADLIYIQGEIYRQQGSFNEALMSYNKAAKISPGFAPAYLGIARVDLNSNPPNLSDAKKNLEKAIQLDPTMTEAVLEVVNLSLEQGDPGAALDQLAKASDQVSLSPVYYLYRAKAEILLSQPEKAVLDAQKANQMDITLLPTYRMLGEALIAANHLEEASRPLAVYVQFVQNDAEVWTWLGQSFYAQNNTEESLKAFNKALGLNPSFFDAYLQRGRLYLDLNNGELANKDLSIALQIKPKSFRANIDLGRALMILEKYGNAWNQFSIAEAFIKSDIEKAEFLFWRGQSLDQLGKTNEALRDYRTLLSLPASIVQPAWKDFAEQRIKTLMTLTPLPGAQTKSFTPGLPSKIATSTPHPTDTRWPTITPKPGLSTRTPTSTILFPTSTSTK